MMTKQDLNIKNLSGVAFLALLPIAFCMGVYALVVTYPKMEAPAAQDLVNGHARDKFEKSFDENALHRSFSMNAWGLLEYTLFRDGRPGVLVGQNGWLFTSEEFQHLRHEDTNLRNNIKFIMDVHKKLDEQKIKLVVAIIPAKSRIYSDETPTGNIPSYKSKVYESAARRLERGQIPVVRLVKPFKAAASSGNAMFLKTDTHWTPEGAGVAATTIAQAIADLKYESLWAKQKISLVPETTSTVHHGDLLRYVPLGPAADRLIAPDQFTKVTSTVDATGGKANSADLLLGDATLPVTLVGTSYSANTLWGFHPQLQAALNTEIVNAADEGQGPFTTMQKYLESDTIKTSPPALVIWEVPERYLTFHYDLKLKTENPL